MFALGHTSRHFLMSALSQKRTCAAHKPMSALCHKRTFEINLVCQLFDNLVGKGN
jgi:hypothetical protein